jgi:hypothetical protein
VRNRERLTGASIIAVLVVALLAMTTYAAGWIGSDSEASDATSSEVIPSTTQMEPAGITPAPAGEVETDLVGAEPSSDACVMESASVRKQDNGPDVRCVQLALNELGYLDTEASAVFDDVTHAAVVAMQTDANLFVDGVVGRETGLALGVWPDETLSVVRTPAPSPGAVDALGYPLSSVASTGAEAPPLPTDSGSGRRLVYERDGQRIWAVAEDETIIRSWLVSGSKYDNEVPGTHQVYSRSEMSTAWNGQARLPMMVRWLKTDIGAIGFHALPTRIDDGSPYQTEAELGTRLSGGCQRQADLDARFTWDFAQIGTPVVVV